MTGPAGSRPGPGKPGLPSRHVTEGVENAFHRTFYFAMGLDDAAIHRPHVGVVAAWHDAISGAAEVQAVALAAKEGVWQGQATPREFATVCDSPTGLASGFGSDLVTREVVADSVELTVRGHWYDGLVAVAPTGDTLAGLAMAVCRLDVPAVVVPCLGRVGPDSDASARADVAMATVMGVLGLAPLSPVGSDGRGDMEGMARELGMRVATVIRSGGSTPRGLVTEAAVLDAATVLAALGGATHGAVHLLAVARECGLDLQLADLDEPFRSASVQEDPSGGEVSATLGHLLATGLLHGDRPTVTGSTLAAEIAALTVTGEWHHSERTPDQRRPRTAVLHGGLAPEGCVAAVTADGGSHGGLARVCESEADAVAALESGRVGPDDVLVIRGCGPGGGRAMPWLGTLAGVLERRVSPLILVTDGRVPWSPGMVVLSHLGPEATEAGPLAAVVDGDRISVDMVAGAVEVDSNTGGDRQERQRESKPLTAAGAKHAAVVGPARSGALTHPGGAAEVVPYREL